ncbi:hypothetical protein [Corynebacterium halotolerans]|uniref:Uncharacterized protein n=1 Tax=Corynebacterium halotolerans YIM 70093 = DSM 44683 TaxID=1121362 RepID=M1MYL3_9CORY|nr:hypothetical protein [Corynebacterium halotolerans]AGF72814.1 hypothetical protein A605_09060 [Corynebacterium halotolerans YIM 70093 = DSM 44683]
MSTRTDGEPQQPTQDPQPTATPFADVTDSLLLWASQAELAVSQRLAGCDWFPASGYTTDDLEAIDRFFGTFLARQVAAGAKLPELLEITPGLTVASLVARAARVLDRDELLTEYLVGLGLEARPEWVEHLSSHTADLLGRVGLTVPEDGTTAVELLTAHAGVTSSEVGTLLELLDRLPGETTGAEAAALLADGSWRGHWPGSEGDEETDPVHLTATESVARLAPGHLAGLIDAIQALRAFALAHPNSWLDRDRGGLTPALPGLVAEAVVAELRERPVGTLDRASAVGVTTRELRPRLIFDAERGKVCLRLPEQRVEDELGEVSWRVSLDGTTRIFRTGRPWGEPTWAEALDVTVEHQVREVTVQDVTNGITWTTPVVDTEDPVLLFAVNGQDLTGMATLHHPEVWVLTPPDSELSDVVTGDELPVLETVEVHGWTSWTARRLDLSHAASLQVTRPGQTPSATTNHLRCVDPRQRVRFRHPEAPLDDVKTLSGLPLHPVSLVAEFPPTISGHDEIWQLSISAYARPGTAGDEVAPPEPLEVPAEGGVFAIFDPEVYDSPWVGEYLIRLRGPRNESFRHRYALVEGMSARTLIDDEARTVRIPAGAGLSEASLSVSAGEKAFGVEPRRITVDAASAGANFAVTTEEGDYLPLRFTPPRLSFELPVRDYPPMWRTTRLVCAPRDLDAEGELRVRVGGEMGNPQVRVVNHHGAPVRTVNLTAADAQTYTGPVAQLASSAATLPSGRIELEWNDVRVNRRTAVTLADLSKDPHAAGVSIEDGHLVVDGAATGRSLAAWVWPLTAPWASAVTLPELTARTPLPEAFVDAGPLAVLPHSADPFTTLRAPQTPGASALVAEQPGHLADQPGALADLSAFLAGETDDAPADPSVMPVLWDLLAGWGDADHSELADRRRAAVTTAFAAAPGAALAALAASLVPAEQQPGRVIASGLATVPLAPATGDGAEDDPDEAESLAAAVIAGDTPDNTTRTDRTDRTDGDDAEHHAAWIGAMELLGALPAAAGEAEEGNPQRLRELRRKLAEIAGKGILTTLATGRDATLDTAGIDQSTVLIARMDATQQEALLASFFSSAELVPGAILDDNTRLLAIFETFHRREELTDLLTSEGLIKPAVSLLRALRSSNRQLYSSARIRFDKLDAVNTEDRDNAWALAPVVSLVFALAARMHAHGLMGKSRTLEAASTGWSRLADVVPDLVTGDLVAAEAMVLAETYPQLAG